MHCYIYRSPLPRFQFQSRYQEHVWVSLEALDAVVYRSSYTYDVAGLYAMFSFCSNGETCEVPYLVGLARAVKWTWCQ